MLMAYDDHGFTIKDIPAEDSRTGANPIQHFSKAKDILEWAENERPTVHWIIEGKGPFRVRESN